MVGYVSLLMTEDESSLSHSLYIKSTFSIESSLFYSIAVLLSASLLSFDGIVVMSFLEMI